MDHCPDDGPADLVMALAAARSAQIPGPRTPAGSAVRAWPGPPVPLTASAGAGAGSRSGAGSGSRSGAGDLDVGTLLRLSLAAADKAGRLRPVPSAGALHPVDTVVTVGAGCSLPPGRYGYDPLRHRAHRLGRHTGGTRPGLTAELSVTVRRTASQYGHRAWPLLLLDTGHAAAALVLAARALGAGEPVARLHGLTGQPDHGLAEVYIPPPGTPAVGGSRVPSPTELLARRSAPPPLQGVPSEDALRAVLATAVREGGDLRWCAAVGTPRPGLLELAPDGRALRRLATGEARPALAAWAAGQAWIAEAGAVLLAYGCPTDADAPHIRRTHLRAGFAVHHAHLTALRHQLAARPVGSWQQADLGAALGGAPGRDWIVHGMALGTRHADEENTT
ncbi:SagB/ThcOx family dehydrogenase [Streptomyces sp. NPDC002644]